MNLYFFHMTIEQMLSFVLLVVIILFLFIYFKQKQVICDLNNIIGLLHEHNDILQRQLQQSSEETGS